MSIMSDKVCGPEAYVAAAMLKLTMGWSISGWEAIKVPSWEERQVISANN